MIAKADRGRTMVIIHKDILKQKFYIIIQENRIIRLNKDPKESFQNHIQQTMHKCNTIIDKNQQKYLVPKKKTLAPKLNNLIKTHKEDKPIRPIINNIQAPSYQLARYLKKINQLIKLPYTYATKNSKEVVQDLNNIQINNHHKITILDIKDLYVHLPTQNIINITKFWLNKNGNQNIIVKQTLELIRVILDQNYI
jgi:hypothetical protein